VAARLRLPVQPGGSQNSLFHGGGFSCLRVLAAGIAYRGPGVIFLLHVDK